MGEQFPRETEMIINNIKLTEMLLFVSVKYSNLNQQIKMQKQLNDNSRN